MKKLSILFILVTLLLSGCKKDMSEDPTPWDLDVASISIVQEA
jgi:hypothetical protein